jgi:hypothetical protein
MLVHLRNEAFPYKTVPVLRIKSAFATMLQNKVVFHVAWKIDLDEPVKAVRSRQEFGVEPSKPVEVINV